MECGATVRLSIQIDESHRIGQAKFKAAGCSELVTALSMLTERVTGMTPVDAAGIAQSPANLFENALQLNCAKLACNALLGAIQKYSDAARDEWNGDDPLICTCFCVSEGVIALEIQQKGLATIAEVTRACNAGGGCGSCHSLIEELLGTAARF